MRDIDAKIEDGSYFIEAKKWYNEIFLRPAAMNATMRFVAYAVICVSVIAIYHVNNSFPLSRKVTMVANLANTAQYYPVIKKLKTSDGIRKSVINYLSVKYIKARETYSPDFFSQDYYFVQRSSETKVFDDYYTDLKNKSNEAFELFNKGFGVEIIPLSTEYDDKNNQILITFEKKVISKQKKIQKNTKFKATITYYMSRYDFAESITTKLDFIVTGYKLDQIKT
jgi:type IV secretion system protein VirB8